MTARKSDWKTLPFEGISPIPYEASFDARETAKINAGLIPQAMEDKWFIYFDDPHLFIHRSWTGMAVYRVKFEDNGKSFRTVEAMCAVSILDMSDAQYETQLLDFLVSNLLLGKNRNFPISSKVKKSGKGDLFQHHISGSAYPMQTIRKKPWWQFWR